MSSKTFYDLRLCPHNVQIELDCEKCDRKEPPCAAYAWRVAKGLELAGNREAMVAAHKQGKTLLPRGAA